MVQAGRVEDGVEEVLGRVAISFVEEVFGERILR